MKGEERKEQRRGGEEKRRETRGGGRREDERDETRRGKERRGAITGVLKAAPRLRDPDTESFYGIWNAAVAGDLQAVRALARRFGVHQRSCFCQDLSCRCLRPWAGRHGHRGSTALLGAAGRGHLEVVKELLAHGAVNTGDNEGRGPRKRLGKVEL
eukprot:Skav229391  [mRNA]  locus=scaffold904:11786:14526:+ [translate_table: standard]